MKKALYLLVLLLAALSVLVAAAPWLLPEQTVRGRAAMLLENAIGREVRIARLAFRVLPRPRIDAQGVRILNAAGNPEVDIGALHASGTLFGLLARRPRLERVRLSEVVVHTAELPRPVAAPPADVTLFARLPFRLREVGIEGLRLQARAGAALGPYEAQLELDDRTLRSLRLARSDGAVRMELLPDGAAYRVTLDGAGWRLPVAPAVRLERLHAEGRLRGAQLELTGIAARCFGGRLQGRLWLGWGEHWTAESRLQLAQIDVHAALAALGHPAVSGTLEASGDVILDAGGPRTLLHEPVIQATFRIRDGVIHAGDLERAVAASGGPPLSGGETGFSEASGHLAVHRGTVRLTQLRLVSDTLDAGGTLRISPRRDIDGLVDVAVADATGVVTVPVQITGSLDRPLLRSGPGALHGGAFGPGLEAAGAPLAGN